MDPKDLDEYLEESVRLDGVPSCASAPPVDLKMLRHAVIGVWTLAAFLFAAVLVISRW